MVRLITLIQHQVKKVIVLLMAVSVRTVLVHLVPVKELERLKGVVDGIVS